MGRFSQNISGDRGQFHTVLCDLLGIKYPILQGAMARIGGAELAAAVSNAGGLGILATWGTSLKETSEQIRNFRELSDKPFAVNIAPISPGFLRSRAELVIKEEVKIVTTGRSDPREPIISLLKAHGIIVIGAVPTVKLAIRLEKEGADAVIASGCEAGGHVGQVSTLPLIPQVVDAVKIPVIAAGGIADARGFVASLSLGACGIQMGTRFIATAESEATEKQKGMILQASDEDTEITTAFTGRTARYIRCPELDKLKQLKKKGASQFEITNYLCEIRRQKIVCAPEFRGIGGGQAAGLIKSIKPAAVIINEIIEEAARICLHLGNFVS